MSKQHERSITKFSTDVSFKAAGESKDYGTIHIPQETKVERFRDSDDAPWSDWFVMLPEAVCPEKYYFDGKPGEMFMHDATHYGIRVPNDHVLTTNEMVEIVSKKVQVAKLGNTYLKIIAIKFYREMTGAGLADAKFWVEMNPKTYQV